MSDVLKEQVAREAAELAAAPAVPVGPVVGRCHFCGGISTTLTHVETRQSDTGGEVARHKGACCNGRN